MQRRDSPTCLDLACRDAGSPRLHSRVNIDGDASIVAHVTGVKFDASGCAYVEASWMHNGCAQTAWFNTFRLREVAAEDE